MKNYTDFLRYALNPACQKFGKYVRDQRRSLVATGIGILLLLGFGGMAAFPVAALLALIRPAAMFPYWLISEAVRNCAAKDVEMTSLQLELAETKQQCATKDVEQANVQVQLAETKLQCATKDVELANVQVELEAAKASERAALDKLTAVERERRPANPVFNLGMTDLADTFAKIGSEALTPKFPDLSSLASINHDITDLANALSKTGVEGLMPKFPDLTSSIALKPGSALSDALTRKMRKNLLDITSVRAAPLDDSD